MGEYLSIEKGNFYFFGHFDTSRMYLEQSIASGHSVHFGERAVQISLPKSTIL